MGNDFLGTMGGTIAIVPIIIALVQAIKMTGKIPSQFSPLLSMVIGIVVAFLLKYNADSITNIILEGVLYGLSASGLYSGVQVTMAKDSPAEISQATPQTPVQPSVQPVVDNTAAKTQTTVTTTTTAPPNPTTEGK